MSPIASNMEWIRQLCALSVFCGLAMSLAPEGSVKKAGGLCCTVLLLLSVLQGVRSVDSGAFALELQRYRELGQAFSEQAQTKEDRFNRLVIESECEEYILNRAASLGAEDLRAEVSARWDMEGFWVPETAVLRGSIGDGERETLSQWIAADLGIAAEEQEWIDDGG